MSLGNDFIGGFQATRAIREKRLDRDQQSALEKARRDLELERDLKRGQLERDLQGERITADAKKQFNQNFFAAGERDAQNRYGTSEREATQTRAATESAKDRKLRKVLQDDQLTQSAKQFTDRIDFDRQNMGLGAGLKARELQIREDLADYRTDPENPDNEWRRERANQVKDARGLGTPSTPTTPKAPGAFTTPTPPPAHAIAFLKANPSAAADFKKKYGVDPQQFLGR